MHKINVVGYVGLPNSVLCLIQQKNIPFSDIAMNLQIITHNKKKSIRSQVNTILFNWIANQLKLIEEKRYTVICLEKMNS